MSVKNKIRNMFKKCKIMDLNMYSALKLGNICLRNTLCILF